MSRNTRTFVPVLVFFLLTGIMFNAISIADSGPQAQAGKGFKESLSQAWANVNDDKSPWRIITFNPMNRESVKVLAITKEEFKAWNDTEPVLKTNPIEPAD